MSRYQAWDCYADRERGYGEYSELGEPFDTLEAAIEECENCGRENGKDTSQGDNWIVYEITDNQLNEIVWSSEE